MLTPAFELSQNKEFLIIVIKAPFAKISETEIFIEESDFKFFSKPYFLRLALPGNIVEDGREKADYDAEKGVFTITVAKETTGEHFEGLDMLTQLLAPRGQTSAAPPLIQVIDNDVEASPTASTSVDALAENEECYVDGDEEVEEYDWRVEQTPYTEPPVSLAAPKYGFANQKSGVFSRLQEELCRVVDCPEPESLTPAQRRERRLEAEQDKFDPDHYLADLYEDEVITTLLAYKPPWVEELDNILKGLSVEEAVELTEDEKYAMRKLPRKEYLLESGEESLVYLGLLDIIYAYCYNHRTSEGDNNVESGWTISKLSATLSWLEVFTSVEEVVRSCFRRSLCFPLYRHWQLSHAVLADVASIFKIGRRRLLKCLLEVHSLLIDEDTRYVLNDLYITDYCVWIQSASPSKIKSLADTLSKVKLSKCDVNLDLKELERLSEVAMNDSDESLTEVTERLAGVSVLSSTVDEGESTDSSEATDNETSDSEEVTSNSDDSVDSDDNIDDDDVDDDQHNHQGVSESDQCNTCDINKKEYLCADGADGGTKSKPLIEDIDSNSPSSCDRSQDKHLIEDNGDTDSSSCNETQKESLIEEIATACTPRGERTQKPLIEEIVNDSKTGGEDSNQKKPLIEELNPE